MTILTTRVAANLNFLVNMTIITDYYMEPRGEFNGVLTAKIGYQCKS